MNKKPSPAPTNASGTSAPQDQPTFRSNPEVDAKIDAYIKENPKHWAFVQSMPRERLERTVILNEVREADRQNRQREGVMRHVNRNPELKQAFELLVKDLPEDQRQDAIAQLARQTSRVLSRSREPQPPVQGMRV